MSRSLTDVGLPYGQGPPTLAYHEPTRTVIAHVLRPKDKPPRSRLFFRRTTEPRYQPVGDFPEALSIDSFALDPARPALYFLTWTWKKHRGGGAAGDWDALYRFDLAEHRCERVAGRGDLRPTKGYQEPWLCALLTVRGDSRAVFCSTGQHTPESDSGKRRAGYWVAELDLSTLQVAVVTELEALFA